MKGIVVPDRVEDFTADPVELFFDLAYVFAFSQLVGSLVGDPTWGGAGEAALLFGLLWLPWQQLAWAANAVSGNGRLVRLIFLAATAASIPMAAATTTALDDGAEVFAVMLGTIMVLGFAIQALSVERGTGLQRSVVRWITPNVLAIVVLVAGAVVGGDAQVPLWVVGLVIVLGAMVLAGRGEWLVRSAHMAERHGLIFIVALGEVIVAIGLPVVAALQAGEGVPGRTVVALLASGAFAGLLWWGYFDRVSPALEHRGEAIEGDVARGRYVRDVYAWAHGPIVAGVILAAAALEEVTLHPSDPLALSFRLMLAGGLAAMLLGMSAAVWRAFRAVAWERIVCAGAVFALLLIGADANGLVLLVGVVVAMAVTLLVEHRRIER